MIYKKDRNKKKLNLTKIRNKQKKKKEKWQLFASIIKRNGWFSWLLVVHSSSPSFLRSFSSLLVNKYEWLNETVILL